MPISIERVEEVAALAKLRLPSEEKARLAKELDQIVAYVEKLNEVDTDQIEPTSQVVESPTALREDQVDKWLTQEGALHNAPVSRKGYFSVPKVIG